MLQNPQKWPFPSRTRLGLDRDTAVCHTRVQVLKPYAVLTWINVDTAPCGSA
ncbi:hypothetical protein F383_32404 [Gossypium arboreum]|uniref:Uncharacterized protein n=1 Tax=Gossypium arboreum TaxID=29729 RepID=A0A0B0MWI5_GOSAR|nr:hypothetical protein F383_32404 [Gossypium arboreum]